VSKFTIVVPRYDQRFHCIGSDCEDTSCCQAWVVGIDPAALEKYKALPPSALRTQLDECILSAESNQSQNLPGGFASIRMLPSGECPFLSGDRLCRIQKDLGKRYLGKICQEYPRQFHKVAALRNPLSRSPARKPPAWFCSILFCSILS
jgi:lysine-N-methylase